MSRYQLIKEACCEVVRRGNAAFNLNLPPVTVSMDLRGRCAGLASMRKGKFYVRLNIDMIRDDAKLQHILEQTIPHEMAHIFCYHKPLLGKSHNSGWKYVCQVLGGNGARCHTQAVIYARGATYAYTTQTGAVVHLSEQRHRKIQAGSTYVFRRGGKVNKGCEYKVVA